MTIGVVNRLDSLLSMFVKCSMVKGATIQSLIDEGITLSAYCHRPACAHSQDLDLRKLRERLGPDHGAMHDDLVPKMRCSKCGSKEVGLIHNPNYARMDADRLAKDREQPKKNLYAKAKGF